MEETEETMDWKLQMEIMQKETIEHMIERDKQQIFWIKKPIEKIKRDLANVMSSYAQTQKLVKKNEDETKLFIEQKKSMHKDYTSRNKIMNEQIQSTLNEVEQQAIFKEVYKNQDQLKKDSNKEIFKQRQEEFKEKKDQVNQKKLKVEEETAKAYK